MKYDKIYVLAPVKISTGGVELSHQLVSILRDKGLDAYIVYVDGKKISSSQMVTPAYLKYNIKIASVIDDSESNMLVLPEIYFDFMFEYNNIKLGFWWMSVDNHFNAACLKEALYFNKSLKARAHILKEHLLKGKYNDKNSVDLMKKEEKRITHFYQSHYAQYFLYSLGFSKILPLSDFINLDILKHVNNVKKENLILYNPKKGFSYTKKIIEKNPNFKFVPLVGYSRAELNDLFDKAKIYIDFGNFPGKDRLPREAVIHKCCIITGKNGTSFFYEDLPIPEEYKIRTKMANLNKISSLIDDIFVHYNDRVGDFDFMRRMILDEHAIFVKEIENIFIE